MITIKHFLRFCKAKVDIKVLIHIRYIANYSKYKITTGIIEGINNTIKNIKRRAYGIKDLQYLKLLAIDTFY